MSCGIIQLQLRKYMDKTVRNSFLSLLIALLALAGVITQPVYAEDENAEQAMSPAKAVTEAAYESAAAAAKANGDYFWRITPSGEAVKCKGGTEVSPAGNENAEAPKLAAKGAALYSYDLGRIVYGKNENERLEPYSTTKLLSCWLALEKLDKDQIVTVSAKATQVYENGTTIWLKEGEKIPVRDLVYGAMLESGNDAAYAIGEAVAGSEAAFADLMNQTVAEWGCKDTHFVNANGWKHKDHYSTAHDMAVITAKCLENAELREIATTKKYVAPATNLSGKRTMRNYLLHVTGGPDGLTGGKTGTWDDDDCAVVCSFSQAGLDAVAVVLGDTEDGRPEDIRKLMAYSHEVTPGFIVPAYTGAVETAMVRHGEKTKTVLATDAVTYAYPAENDARDIRTETEYGLIEAPVKKGQEVGKFLVYADDELIGEHKLLATEDIDTGWFPSYVYISNEATLNALKVLGIFILLLFAVSRIGRKGRKARRRKKKIAAEAQRQIREENAGAARTDRQTKKETRKRLREKYREKH